VVSALAPVWTLLPLLSASFEILSGTGKTESTGRFDSMSWVQTQKRRHYLQLTRGELNWGQLRRGVDGLFKFPSAPLRPPNPACPSANKAVAINALMITSRSFIIHP